MFRVRSYRKVLRSRSSVFSRRCPVLQGFGSLIPEALEVYALFSGPRDRLTAPGAHSSSCAAIQLPPLGHGSSSSAFLETARRIHSSSVSVPQLLAASHAIMTEDYMGPAESCAATNG
ncbi:hypothetical protein DPEC_G00338290 [Dallia pectoralis]|uniref:Uncharacterized protein n=1 Tax=Dallia pectoralis TaxID=75939 RepID=A0ACC2F4K1_DALPE|nr:hypothetical protein DPEC_G00338290 [Dallia pectoralis]